MEILEPVYDQPIPEKQKRNQYKLSAEMKLVRQFATGPHETMMIDYGTLKKCKLGWARITNAINRYAPDCKATQRGNAVYVYREKKGGAKK